MLGDQHGISPYHAIFSGCFGTSQLGPHRLTHLINQWTPSFTTESRDVQDCILRKSSMILLPILSSVVQDVVECARDMQALLTATKVDLVLAGVPLTRIEALHPDVTDSYSTRASVLLRLYQETVTWEAWQQFSLHILKKWAGLKGALRPAHTQQIKLLSELTKAFKRQVDLVPWAG